MINIGEAVVVAVLVGIAVWGALRIAVYQIEQERKREREKNNNHRPD